jgi:hypothetical protein
MLAKRGQMLLATVLNKLQRFKGVVYEQVRMARGSLEVMIRPRKGSRPICSRCGTPGVQYDRQQARKYRFVPLWGIDVFFVYEPRRVTCSVCSVVVCAFIAAHFWMLSGSSLRICASSRSFLSKLLSAIHPAISRLRSLAVFISPIPL